MLMDGQDNPPTLHACRGILNGWHSAGGRIGWMAPEGKGIIIGWTGRTGLIRDGQDKAPPPGWTDRIRLPRPPGH